MHNEAHDGIKLCMKCGVDEVSNSVAKKRFSDRAALCAPIFYVMFL